MTLPTRPDPDLAERRYLAAARAAAGAVMPRWPLMRNELASSEPALKWLHVARRRLPRR